MRYVKNYLLLILQEPTIKKWTKNNSREAEYEF